MKKNETDVKEDSEKKTYVTVCISAKANKLLNEATERSGRKKTQEARIRIEDHLSRYQSVSEVSNATKFK